MHKLYQNKYSNELNLNLINVRYAEKNVIVSDEFAISLSTNYPKQANDVLTFKLFLYLSSLATENGLSNELILLDNKVLASDLKMANKALILLSLEYLKSITFNYIHKCKGNPTKHSCKIIDDYSASKGYISIKLNAEYLSLLGIYRNQFVSIPNEFFALDIKSYRHSVFLCYYILLHRKRNFSKKNKDVISVKELIKHCPLLPKYFDLGKQKQVSRNIVVPFKNNMDYLASVFNFTWKYEKDVSSYVSFQTNKVLLDCNNQPS